MAIKISLGEDGRKYEYTGHAPKLYWSQYSIYLLKRYYPTTGCDDIAEMLGFSPMTVKRKAWELGLKKDLNFRRERNRRTLKMANLYSRLYGNKGEFKKGEHHGLATEFKPKYTLVRLDTGFVGTSREIADQIGAEQTNVVYAAKRRGACCGVQIRFYDNE